ncbi:MAG: TolC family protein, partial [Proteobacteria bacterium]|nr:TolC family protein [Pseudomonadota bacterium]
IDPTDRPEDYVEYEIDVERAVTKAFVRRPEIASARKEIHREEVELRFAKNQRLPSVNIEGSYGWGGLGGTPRDTAFSAASGPTTGFGDSLTDWGTDEGGENYSIGAVISIPLGNIEGRHNVSKAKLELRRAKTRLKRLEQDIILQVRDGARNLKSAQEGIEAAERKRLAAAEQLRAERIRLEHGESTPFDVLQREEILVEAESQKINALQLYRDSVAELHRAQGTTLEARNVVIGQVMPIR